MAQSISTNTFGVARFVVSPDATQGTHTTISAALASASSGDIIWVREGTYTENVTNKNGVTVQGIATNGGSVVMGSLTISNAGTCFFSNLNFINTAGSALDITGTNAVAITLENIVFNSSGSGAVTLNTTNPNTGGSIFYGCNFINSTVQNFNNSSGGTLFFNNCSLNDSSTLINTLSGSGTNFFFLNGSSIGGQLYITNLAQFNAVNSSFNSAGRAAPTITVDSNNINTGFEWCSVLSSQNCFQVNSPGNMRMQQCNFQGNIAPIVRGTGSVSYSLIVSGFGGTPIFQNTLTLSPLPVSLGTYSTFISSITSVNAADSPYTVLEVDTYLSVDCSGGAVTLLFPDSPIIGQEWVVKDAAGTAATNHITISTVTGSDLIDGGTNYLMSANYEAVNIIASSLSTYQIY